jgi:hypothetical protein
MEVEDRVENATIENFSCEDELSYILEEYAYEKKFYDDDRHDKYGDDTTIVTIEAMEKKKAIEFIDITIEVTK